MSLLFAPKLVEVILSAKGGGPSPNRAPASIKEWFSTCVFIVASIPLFWGGVQEEMLCDKDDVEEDADITQPEFNRISSQAAPVCL